MSKGELAGAVDGYEEAELAFGGLHLGDVDVEEADRIRLERLLGCLVALDFGQTRDAVALQAAVQRGSGQLRDRRLQSVEAVVLRLPRVTAEGYDDDFLFCGQGG